MKAKILSIKGEPEKEIVLPNWFSENIREDISQKYFETCKKIQPYGSDVLAGKRYSACGKLRHARHKWKTTYGHGISRVPRKILWRRGDQFYWIGAGVSGTRGGRRAHPPKPIHFMKKRKINKKEALIALKSGLIATCNKNLIKKRYKSLTDIKVELPIIVSSKILKLKTKEVYDVLKNILKENFEIFLQRKIKKSGKGKIRKGKSKKTNRLLLILGKDEKIKINGIDVKKIPELKMDDLWPLGRMAIYTEKAIDELNNVENLEV